MTATDVTATPGMRAGHPDRATITTVILISSPRPEGVAVVVVLPQGSRLMLDFQDGESVEISSIAADALVRYLLNPSVHTDAGESKMLGDVRLDGGDIDAVRFATADLYSGAVGEVPAERLLPLLGAALGAALEAAAALGNREPAAAADSAPSDDMP